MRLFYAKLVVYTFLLTLIFSGNSFAGAATKWDLEKAHTSINFNIKHFVTTIPGKFDDFIIDLHFDPENLEGSSINVFIQVASINTGWGPRDAHLRTSDWFDANKYPVISFKSSKIMSNGDGNYIANGKLKIKDVETDIDLPFKLLGVKQIPAEMKQMFGTIDKIASFEVSFSLNREEYKVGTGTSTPGKAALRYRQFVGNEVNIFISVEANYKTS
jgi:polyisoprenoid-binding protein YceI